MEPAFNRAEDMLRRVTPEGRALAHRERVERQRRTTRQIGLCVLLAVILWITMLGFARAGLVLGSAIIAAAVFLFVAGCGAIFFLLRPRSVKSAELPGVPLPSVPSKVGEWLEQRRGLLPSPALPLVDSLVRQLSTLGPQLMKVEPESPASTAIRKLISMELPELVERYCNVPPSMAAGEPTSQLIQGLQIINGEIGRMSSDLASGSFDALATQNRYLQLKYEAGLELP